MINKTTDTFLPLPRSWSELSWKQLSVCWSAKIRYGGNQAVAKVAAFLELLELKPVPACKFTDNISASTGEKVYLLSTPHGCEFCVTARDLAYLAEKSMPWFDYPYGDHGTPEKCDDAGNVIQEKREAVRGYVSNMRDAMILSEDCLYIPLLGSWTSQAAKPSGRDHGWSDQRHSGWFCRSFALPQFACNNLTWQQYRSLQAIAPQLFSDSITEEQALELQSQFLAHILTPRSLALLDTSGGSIRIRPHYEYRYNAEQAEGLARWWERQLTRENGRLAVLFHICFQAYQTALSYYAASYPLLFSDSGKTDPLRDALTGEVGTINTIMKYAGYAEQQQVYDSNLPFVLDILNTMTKEAKEIEKMNSKIKK